MNKMLSSVFSDADCLNLLIGIDAQFNSIVINYDRRIEKVGENGIMSSLKIVLIAIVAIALLFPTALMADAQGTGNSNVSSVIGPTSGSVNSSMSVCMGDSITAGAYLMPITTYPGMLGQIIGGSVINSGIGGQNTTQMVARFTTDALDYHPKYLFLLGGTNDILQGTKAAAIEANLNSMIKEAVAGGAKVFLLTVPPDTYFTNAENKVKNNVNTWIEAQGSSNVIVVNIAAPLSESGNANYMVPSYNIGDGEHPSTLGMSIMVETIIQTGQAKGYFSNVKFWTGSSNAKASNSKNWVGDVAPVAGSEIVFDQNSIKGCKLDQAINYGSITVLPGYTGTITLAANIGSTGGQLFTNGTFTGASKYTDTCGGNFVQLLQFGATITSDVLNLVMDGNNSTLQVSSFSFYSLVLGNTAIMFDDAYVLHDLTISPGATVVLEDYGGIVWMPTSIGDKIINEGKIMAQTSSL